MESCCYGDRVSFQFVQRPSQIQGHPHTATSMRSRATSSMLRMAFFSILTSCDSFLARSGPKAPAAFLRKAWPGRRMLVISISSAISPTTGGSPIRLSSLSGVERGESVDGGPILGSLQPDQHPQEISSRRSQSQKISRNRTHRFRPSLAISRSWLWTVVVVGSRPARRSGGATGAWNRCDAWFGHGNWR